MNKEFKKLLLEKFRAYRKQGDYIGQTILLSFYKKEFDKIFSHKKLTKRDNELKGRGAAFVICDEITKLLQNEADSG